MQFTNLKKKKKKYLCFSIDFLRIIHSSLENSTTSSSKPVVVVVVVDSSGIEIPTK